MLIILEAMGVNNCLTVNFAFGHLASHQRHQWQTGYQVHQAVQKQGHVIGEKLNGWKRVKNGLYDKDIWQQTW